MCLSCINYRTTWKATHGTYCIKDVNSPKWKYARNRLEHIIKYFARRQPIQGCEEYEVQI